MTTIAEEPALQRSLKLKIPGSASNLGPGLHTLGLALGLYTYLTFNVLETNDPTIPLVTVAGQLAEGGMASTQSALISTILKNLWHTDADVLKRVRITIDSEIPPGSGLSSTATAQLGAMWASFLLQDLAPAK